MCFMLLLAILVAASAIPSQEPRSVPLQLAESSHRAICPITIEYDTDVDRVPQRIKLIRCDTSNSFSSAKLRHVQRCEGLSRERHEWGCVELFDSVLVYSRKGGDVKRLDVPVGCTCMRSTPQNAILIPERDR